MKFIHTLTLALFGLAALSCSAKEEAPVILGDEQFDVYMPLLEGQRVAIFSNQTGLVGGGSEHVLDVLLAKGVNLDPEALDKWTVIDMATVNGAKALGRNDIGLIAPGMKADLTVIDLKKPHLYPVNDLSGLVVNSMQASAVIMTIVGGSLEYTRGVYKNIDTWQARLNIDESVRHCNGL